MRILAYQREGRFEISSRLGILLSPLGKGRLLLVAPGGPEGQVPKLLGVPPDNETGSCVMTGHNTKGLGSRGAGPTPIPEYVRAAVKRVYAKTPVEGAVDGITDGLPSHTWNGMTPDTFAVGQKGGGSRQVHLLPPGVHPASSDEAKHRFAWNAERQAHWAGLVEAAAELKSDYGITHIAVAGSFVTTDYPFPGDVDVIAFTDAKTSDENWSKRSERDSQPFSAFNRKQGEGGVHAYAPDGSIFFAGGPSSLYGFRFAPPNPRPPRPVVGGPKGPEVGLVLLDVEELLESSGAKES